jgi:hypothetical protein
MTDLRDITADLQARLDLIGSRRREEEHRHVRALQELDGEVEMIKHMLDLERRLLADRQAKASAAKPLLPGAATPLESEILEILGNKKEWEHAEIKAELVNRGAGRTDDPTFGRSLQGTLLSMRSRELVDLLGVGVWRIAEKRLNSPKNSDATAVSLGQKNGNAVVSGIRRI